MAHACNISPSRRPAKPSLNRGPVQCRRAAPFFVTDKPVLSTNLIVSHDASASFGGRIARFVDDWRDR